MFRYQIRNLIVLTSTWILFFASYALSENIVSLSKIQMDNACGPRCLYAIMQISKEGKPNCGIKCIYELIGKKPFTAVNMKELRDVAGELGFGARGYKFSIKDLAEIKNKDYAILPVGDMPGTLERPLHFILVETVNGDYVTIVNTKTLERVAIPVSALQQQWQGYALVISTSGKNRVAKKERGKIISCNTGQYDQIKDFGVVDSGSVLQYTFNVAHGTEDISEIKIVSKSCSCLKAELGKDTEGNQILSMELGIDRPAWQQAHAVVLLKPGDIIKRYAVRAYGKNSFQITPQKGYFEVLRGDKIEYPVKIEYFTGIDDIVQFDRFESNIAGLKIGQVKTENATKNKVSTFIFDIPLIFDSTLCTKGIEMIEGKVKFVLNTVKEQRFIPFEFVVKIGTEKFQLTPQKMFITISQTNCNSINNNKVKIEFLTKGHPEKITVQAKKDLPFETNITQISDGSYIIELIAPRETLENLEAGLHKSEMIIIPKFKDSSNIENIILPVSLFISGEELTVQDIVNIAKANFEQIEDIEFTFCEKRYTKKPNELSKEYITQTSWIPEKKWEKQISKIRKPGDEVTHVSIHGWDGNNYKSRIGELQEDGHESTKQGRVSGNRPTFREDILSAMGMKGKKYTYIDRLASPNAFIEGQVSIDAHQTIIINTSFGDTSKDGNVGKMYTKYYIDVERGGIPLQYELYSNGELLKTVKNVTIAKTESGTYLPIRGEVYGKSKFDGESKVIEYVVDLKSVKINQGLEQKHFNVEFERNLPVWDDNVGIGYYNEVGLQPENEVDQELFDQLIEKVEISHSKIDTENPISSELPRVALDPKGNATEDVVSQENVPRSSLDKKLLWIVFLIVFVLFAIVFIYKKNVKS